MKSGKFFFLMSMVLLLIFSSGCIKSTLEDFDLIKDAIEVRCEEVNGNICESEDYCEEWISATDTANCCLTECICPEKQNWKTVLNGEKGYECIIPFEGKNLKLASENGKYLIEYDSEIFLFNLSEGKKYTYFADENVWKWKSIETNNLFERMKKLGEENCIEFECSEKVFGKDFFHAGNAVQENIHGEGINNEEPAEETAANENIKVNGCEEKTGLSKDSCWRALAIENKDTALCQKLETLSVNICLEEVAVASGDYSICLTLEDASIDNCIYKVSVETGNETACEIINDINTMNDCYYEVAIKKDDYSMCSKIDNSFPEGVGKKDNCFYSFAVSEGNGQLCDLISLSYADGEYKKYSCYLDIIDVDPVMNYCNSILDENSANECYSKVGIANQDINSCNMITEQQEKYECVSSIAKNQKDYIICNNISGRYFSDCIIEIVKLTGEIEACSEIDFNLSAREDCYYESALKSQNPAYCEKITKSTEYKDNCFKEVAILNSDSNSCKKISMNNTEDRDYCLMEVSFSLISPEICEEILRGENYLECFLNISEEVDDYTICELMEKQYVLEYSNYPLEKLCIKNFAINTGEVSLCSQITDVNLHAACIDGNSNFR